MAQKRDDYDEDSQEERFSIDKLTILTGISLILICELFLYFLSAKTQSSFGLTQITFALIAGIVLTLYLIWTRFIMASNRYLGGFLSVAGIISVAYALTRKYQGIYTTIFMSIGVLLGLFYTIFYFVKAGKK